MRSKSQKKNRQKKTVSWLESNGEDLGNESQKNLFEDTDFNSSTPLMSAAPAHGRDVCDAVTEEETNNGVPVTETILEETSSNDSNTPCPLDGEIKPTSYETDLSIDEEAEQLTFEDEQRAIKTCLDTHIEDKANNPLFRTRHWDSNHGLGSPILRKGEAIGNVRIESYSSDLGLVVPEIWCVTFKAMGDDNRIIIRFLQNTSTGELCTFGREVEFIFIVIDPSGFNGIMLKQMMTNSNVFEIRLKALHVDSSWVGKFVSADDVTLVWLNVDHYYKLKPFKGLTSDDSDDEDDRSLTSAEEQEVVSFNGVNWLPTLEVSELPTMESNKSLPDANNVDAGTAPTADMTADDSREGEDEIVSLLTEAEVPEINRANCVDEHDVSGFNAKLDTVLRDQRTITETTADNLQETRLVREDVSKVDKKVDDVGKEVRDIKELLLNQNNTGDSQPSRRQYTHSSGTSLKKPPSGRPVPFRNATNTIHRSSSTTATTFAAKKPLRTASNPPSSIRRRSTTTISQAPRVANLDSRKPARQKFESNGSSGSRKLPWER
ncbi:hypothetical protein ACHAWC_010118 [Mediolabrus comicus]